MKKQVLLLLTISSFSLIFSAERERSEKRDEFSDVLQELKDYVKTSGVHLKKPKVEFTINSRLAEREGNEASDAVNVQPDGQVSQPKVPSDDGETLCEAFCPFFIANLCGFVSDERLAARSAKKGQ